MADISTINGIPIASISKVNGRTLAASDNILGISKPAAGGPSGTLLSETFDGLTGTDGRSHEYTVSGIPWSGPTDWAKTNADNVWTIYGSTNTYSGLTGNNRYLRGWVFGFGTTPSQRTGCGGGMDGGVDATAGDWTNTSSQRYMYLEASSPASANNTSRRHMVRTAAFDFSGVSSITMTFWFHMYGDSSGNNGSGTNRMGSLGVAATTDASSASSAVEAGTGLGFTSDSAGGCTISHWANSDGSTISVGTRISGRQQTTGHTTSEHPSNTWRKATIDLSNAAGESTVYIYFLGITDNSSSVNWAGDICIDNIKIVGS